MITGLLFRDSIISAANNISNSRQAVDALNVFPVPGLPYNKTPFGIFAPIFLTAIQALI